MTDRPIRALDAIWRRRHSPELWLLASNLGARALGFWVSLLVSRFAGVEALGMYSGLLITASSPTTPMSAAIANNATVMTARQAGQVPPSDVMVAQGRVLGGSFLLALGGCWVMLQSSGLNRFEQVSEWLIWMAVLGLVAGQLLTQLTVGVCHGANHSVQASKIVCGVSLLGGLTAYPLLQWWGVSGVLVQAVFVGIVPGVVIAWWLFRTAPKITTVGINELAGEASERLRAALPNVMATVVNNMTNWVACIYLAEKVHGKAGLGLVAIGLQWMAVMLLPMTSWSGRVMRALTLAHQQSPVAFRGEIRAQIRKCLLVSLGTSLLVAAATPLIASLYVVDRHELLGMFVINALAATLVAVNFVYERVFYCLSSQRPWLLASLVAYVGQIALTWLVLPYSIWAVALGNLLAVVVVAVLMTLYLRRRLAGGEEQDAQVVR